MIADYLNQTCTIEYATTGFDDFGNPTTETLEAPCRFSNKMRQIAGMSGEILVSSAQVLLDSDVSIQPGDHITFGGRKWHVEQVIGAYDLDGELMHWRVSLT